MTPAADNAGRDADPRAALCAAVSDALDALGRPDRATVLVNDPQRHTDSNAVLCELAGRVDLSACRVLVATGTHAAPPADQRETFERALLAGTSPVDAPTRVAWHDAGADSLIDVAGRWRGNAVLADGPVLAIGSVEPHYFAGFTGAHKTCTIGCASWADVEANHARALSDAAAPCRLAGNPVYEGVAEMTAALERVTDVAVVNVVQVGRRIVAAAGGSPLDALARLAAPARRHFTRELLEPVDALVLDVAGPLARTFYQADKAIKNSEPVVRDGGCIVLRAGCEDGIGQDHFVSLLREAPTHRAAVRAVENRGYRLGDHKAVRLRRLTDPAVRGVSVFAVCPGLSDEHLRLLGFARARNTAAALVAAGMDPVRQTIVEVPDAGNTCCVLDAPGGGVRPAGS